MRKAQTRPGIHLTRLAAASVLPFMATVASAQTTSADMSVSATVTTNCTVSTSAVDFGSVDALSGSNTDASGAITVTCTNGTSWAASAGVGSGAGATLAGRRLSSGGNLLNYNLFTDASRSSIWGDGTGTTATISDTGTGAGQNVDIYGRISGGQGSVPAGSYSDTVAVTITF